MDNTRQQKIDAVREICNLLEANPAMRLPFEIGVKDNWTVYARHMDEFLAALGPLPDPAVAPAGYGTKLEAVHRFGGTSGLALNVEVAAGKVSAETPFATPKPVTAYDWDVDAIVKAARDLQEASK